MNSLNAAGDRFSIRGTMLRKTDLETKPNEVIHLVFGFYYGSTIETYRRMDRWFPFGYGMVQLSNKWNKNRKQVYQKPTNLVLAGKGCMKLRTDYIPVLSPQSLLQLKLKQRLVRNLQYSCDYPAEIVQLIADYLECFSVSKTFTKDPTPQNYQRCPMMLEFSP